jgi:hypothetical protein
MRLRGMESRAGPLYQVERGGCLDVAMHAPTIAVILQENSGVRGCVPEKHPDQVPAGMFRHNVSGETFYNIPRGDRGNGWIATAPHRDMERLKAVAQGIMAIRMIKQIPDIPDQIVEAVNRNTLAVFIGAGVSRHWGVMDGMTSVSASLTVASETKIATAHHAWWSRTLMCLGVMTIRRK